MKTLIISIGGIAAVTVLMTWIVLVVLRRRQIMDLPNHRSSHSFPVPRGGGIAVVGVLLTVWAVGYMYWPNEMAGVNGAVLFGALGLAALSWMDDLRGLPAGVRLLGHIVACAAAMPILYSIGPVFQGFFPPYIDTPIAVLVWVGFVNFYNFMDGIDGITGVESASIGAGAALVAVTAGSLVLDPFPALVLAAVAIGFLVWNWHPAQIFLGDVGSVPLGYLIGWMLLLLAAEGNWIPALVLPLYYLADASITLVWRLLDGEKIWQPHRRHFYQRAHQGGRSHSKVVSAIATCNMTLIGWAILSNTRPWLSLAGAAFSVALLLLWMGLCSRHRPRHG